MYEPLHDWMVGNMLCFYETLHKNPRSTAFSPPEVSEFPPMHQAPRPVPKAPWLSAAAASSEHPKLRNAAAVLTAA